MTAKNRIDYFLRSRKLNIFLLFLALALLFSVLTKLSDDYTHTIAFEITPVNVPEDQVIVKDSTHQLNITLTTYGFRLMKYYLSKPSLSVDFGNVDQSSSHYVWNQNKGLPELVSQFDPDTRIDGVNPDTIRFLFDVNTVRKVPVLLEAQVEFSPGFDLLGEYEISPDSIKVIGPGVITDTITSVSTKLLNLSNINSDISTQVGLELPSGLHEVRFSEDQVQVNGKVDKFSEGTITVPVNIINVPEDVQIQFYPKTVSVSYYTSLTDFKTISSSSFIVECDYSEFSDQESFLVPRITEQPDQVKNVRLFENRIEIILLQ